MLLRVWQCVDLPQTPAPPPVQDDMPRATSARERNALKRKAKQLARKGSASQPAPSVAATKGAAPATSTHPPADPVNALAPAYVLDAAHDVDEWTAIEHGRYGQPSLSATCLHMPT